MRPEFQIIETNENGMILKVTDLELADQFDDFLSEKCYIFYTQKFSTNFVEFFFGQLGSTSKLTDFIEKFETSFA